MAKSILHEIKAPNGDTLLYFGSGPKKKKPGVKILVGPVVAAAAAAALWEVGKGILQGIGAKLVDALFNDKPDLDKFFHDLVAAISEVVKEALDENEFQNCLADIESFKVLMTEYITSPKTRAATLNKIVDDAMFPISRIERLEKGFPITVQAYIMAGMFRITALQEFAKRSGDRRDFKNFTDFAKLVSAGAKAAIPSLVAMNDARVTVVQQRFEQGGCHRVGPDYICFNWHIWFFTVDGKEVPFPSRSDGNSAPNREPEAQQARADALNSVRNEFQSSVMAPLNHSIDLLDQISRMKR